MPDGRPPRGSIRAPRRRARTRPGCRGRGSGGRRSRGREGDDGRGADVAEFEELPAERLPHRIVDADRRERLAPLPEPRLVVLGDVDPGGAKEGADPADDARDVVVGEDDEGLAGCHVDAEPGDPGQPWGGSMWGHPGDGDRVAPPADGDLDRRGMLDVGDIAHGDLETT